MTIKASFVHLYNLIGHKDANALIDHYRTMNRILQAPNQELEKLISYESMMRLVSAKGLRYEEFIILDRPIKVYKQMEYLKNLQHEEMWALLLNDSYSLLHKMQLGKGTEDTTVVDVKALISSCSILRASHVYLVHNHPSGNITPSREDIETTKGIRDALNLINITLLDHIIIAHDQWANFKRQWRSK